MSSINWMLLQRLSIQYHLQLSIKLRNDEIRPDIRPKIP